ncbi:UDP-2,3-diacylglucosamine diphosphatase [Undibacterium sp. Ren11W]|uniref:UDP-2,3-diacylglucosamine diphosphatase n=1 Tax=Undibacterium sp. Ren11W TaxID=3413045 RepID=UPI003BF365B8
MTTSPAPLAQAKLLALFASDIHLHPALARTTDYFLNFLKQQAPLAERLYLMGDLFEYWAGDDDMDEAYHQIIVHALRELSDAGTRIFWIAGNRDFLIGNAFAAATGCQLLPDPSRIDLAGHAIAITHGDALCTDDVAYMQFRNMVRQTQWQDAFLQQPLSQRKAIIEGMRINSKTEQKSKSAEIMDAHPDAIRALFTQQQVDILIHGHTHRTALHQHAEGLRYVLPDWECDGAPQKLRGGWLAINQDGQFLAYHVDGSADVLFKGIKDTPP